MLLRDSSCLGAVPTSPTSSVFPGAQQLQIPLIANRMIYEIKKWPSEMYSWSARAASQALAGLSWNMAGGILLFSCWHWTVRYPTDRVGFTFLVFVVLVPFYYTTVGQAIVAIAPTVEIAALSFTSAFSFVLNLTTPGSNTPLTSAMTAFSGVVTISTSWDLTGVERTLGRRHIFAFGNRIGVQNRNRMETSEFSCPRYSRFSTMLTLSRRCKLHELGSTSAPTPLAQRSSTSIARLARPFLLDPVVMS